MENINSKISTAGAIIAPLLLQLVIGLFGALFDGNKTVGCIGLAILLVIILIIIF